MTIPAALATTIFILLMFSIVLVHQWEPRSTVRPNPLNDTPTPPLGTLVIYGAHWECWGGHVLKSATHPIIRLLIPVFQGVQSEFGMGGESDPSRFLKQRSPF